jgi:imidazolonepropionase-like amidohydrolase
MRAWVHYLAAKALTVRCGGYDRPDRQIVTDCRIRSRAGQSAVFTMASRKTYRRRVPAWTFSGELLDGAAGERVVIGTGPEQPLPGRFGLAGLVDAHAHPSVDVDQDGPFLADRVSAEAKLRDYAAHGVTVVRDVGGLNTVTLDFAQTPMTGRPVVSAAGRFLAAPGRYFPRMYVPTSADHLLDAIREEVRAGAEWIKIIGDFPEWGDAGPVPDTLDMTYDLDTLRRSVELAHSLGVRLALHSNLPASELVAIGVDSFEHGTGLTRADVEALGARRGAWTPTLGAIMAQRNAPDAALRRRIAEAREHMRDLLPYALGCGVHVLAGTDVVVTIAEEIALLAECGLTVEQALAAAGSSAREYLGVQPEGDLVTYDADPRANPEVLSSPASVIIRGVRVV